MFEGRLFVRTISSGSIIFCDNRQFLYVLYTIAGWAVFKEKSKIQRCQTCLDAILGNKTDAPEQSLLTELKSFSSGAGLTHPSKTILKALIAAESVFQTNRAKLTAVGNVHSFLVKGFTDQFAVTNFPTCHNVLSNIVSRFFRLRIYMLATKMTVDSERSEMKYSTAAEVHTVVQK